MASRTSTGFAPGTGREPDPEPYNPWPINALCASDWFISYQRIISHLVGCSIWKPMVALLYVLRYSDRYETPGIPSPEPKVGTQLPIRVDRVVLQLPGPVRNAGAHTHTCTVTAARNTRVGSRDKLVQIEKAKDIAFGPRQDNSSPRKRPLRSKVAQHLPALANEIKVIALSFSQTSLRLRNP